jgi:hypothetical protein
VVIEASQLLSAQTLPGTPYPQKTECPRIHTEACSVALDRAKEFV